MVIFPLQQDLELFFIFIFLYIWHASFRLGIYSDFCQLNGCVQIAGIRNLCGTKSLAILDNHPQEEQYKTFINLNSPFCIQVSS